MYIARISACSVSGKRTSTPDGFDSADDVFAEEVRYYPANCSPRVSDDDKFPKTIRLRLVFPSLDLSLQQNERRQTTGDFVSQNRADGKCHVTQYEDVWDAVNSQSIAESVFVIFLAQLFTLYRFLRCTEPESIEMLTSFCLLTFVLFALKGKTHGGEEYNYTEDDSPRPGVVVAVVVGTCCVLAVVALVIILFIRKKVMRTKNPSPQKEKTTQLSRVSPPQNENGKMSVHLAQYEDVCDATHSQNNAGVDIRFLNHQNDVIHSIVNHYINITFAVDWVNCSLSTRWRLNQSYPDPDGEAFVPAVNSTHDPLYRQVLMGGVIACSVIVVVSIIGGVIVCYRLGMIRRRPQAGGRRQNSAKGFLTDGWESDRPQSEGLYDDLYCSTKL
ncbi:hypothetical protein C0Q70_12137 [Pomacea canaliculata]|uniref:Uncharacterized protein n=1 Tax=Pomacea canaliculata TaxID=400727 RepID=A0A2T7P0P1_POMCA|nr:hypothetical protein C0Q70_12137 [Pomacea canaliculata]